MEDIGRHPDSGKPPEYEHEYETRTSYETVCPWCDEDVELDHDIEGVFWMALGKRYDKQECWNCEAQLEISYSFVELGEGFAARVEIEIAATKRIA